MLAGERFTDHPASVCPVVASFLRTYNDLVDDRRRQDLYAYAAKVVGSRGSNEIESARAERLNEWVLDLPGHRWIRLVVPRRLRLLRPAPGTEAAGSRAARSLTRHTDRTHAEVLRVIDELLAMGASEAVPAAPPAPVSRPSGALTRSSL
jgi:hypothetical protein